MNGDVLDLDALDQAAAVRRGDIAPAELVDAAAERVATLNPMVNAVVHEWFGETSDELRRSGVPSGVFGGVPLLVKDSLCHPAGRPHTEGMRGLQRIGWVEPEDCALSAAFRRAGFAFVGKTNAPEFAALPTTEPLAYGPTRNPWAPDRSVGGSSGGSAAAVASGMVAVAHGTDASGSIRVPASMCGVVGLKPSRGRTPLAPDWSEWMGPVAARYVQHVLTRSVRDAAAVLDCIAVDPHGTTITGDDAPDRGRFLADVTGPPPRSLRVALYDDLSAMGVPVDKQIAAAVGDTARLLERLGHRVEVAHPPVFDQPPPLDDPQAIAGASESFFTWFFEYLQRRTGTTFGEDDVEPYTWSLIQAGRSGTATGLYRVMEWMNGTAQAVAKWWATSGYDLLLSPTLPELPPVLGSFDFDPANPVAVSMRITTMCAFTFPWNWSGDPAISLPLASSTEGLPIGIQLVAPWGHESLLLATSAQLEQASPWSARRLPR